MRSRYGTNEDESRVEQYTQYEMEDEMDDGLSECDRVMQKSVEVLGVIDGEYVLVSFPG